MRLSAAPLLRNLFFIIVILGAGVAGAIFLTDQGRSVRAGEPGLFYLSPDGADDPAAGGSEARPFRTLQYALNRVPCGSRLQLADGRYEQDTDVNRPDCQASPAPIRVTGEAAAVIVGAGDTYILEILAGNITFEGMTLDGEFTPGDYRKKLVYFNAEGINRVNLTGMTLRNAREECVRLRLNASHNVIQGNRFEWCGRVGGGTTGDNREAIYLGTTAAQLANDQTSYNWVIGNTFNQGILGGSGSECIDIKGSAHHNLVEGNQCFNQASDPESGGINVEGAANLILNNLIEGNAGSGIRLGMGEATTERLNRIMGNTLRGNDAFGINALFEPSAAELELIRDNCIENNAEGMVNRNVLAGATGGACWR